MVYSASISYEIGGGPPYEYKEIWTPLGIAYPLAMIKKYHPEFQIKIIDQALNKYSNEKMTELLLAEKFDLIGLSSYIWNSSSLQSWITTLKKENYISNDLLKLIMHRTGVIPLIESLG